MKKNLLLIALSLALTAEAQMQFINLTTLHTNITVSSALMTLNSICTNNAYTASNHNTVTVGDPPATAYAEINSSFAYITNQFNWLLQLPLKLQTNWLALSNSLVIVSNSVNGCAATNVTLLAGLGDVSWTLSNFLTTNTPFVPMTVMSFDSGAITSDGSGNLSAASVKAGLWDATYSSGISGYVPTADGAGNWYWAEPTGGGGALPTNAWLGASRVVAYSTNYAFWGASNFLARVSGLYSWRINGGSDNANPPGSIPVRLVGSFDEITWFPLTNGFQTSADISVSLLTNGFSFSGLPLVNPGNATLFSIDHWENIGKVNNGFGEVFNFDEPTEPANPATKGYVDSAVANAAAGQWFNYSDTLGSHQSVARRGVTALDLSFQQDSLYRGYQVIDTNLVISVAWTNLTPGWGLYASTNLAAGEAGFVPFTNYVSGTNIGTGWVTFTTPLLYDQPMYFFDPRGPATGRAQFNVPVVFSTGTIYPSNTWNLASITNRMGNMAYWQGSSNGQALVTLQLSNGVVRWVQTLR